MCHTWVPGKPVPWSIYTLRLWYVWSLWEKFRSDSRRGARGHGGSCLGQVGGKAARALRAEGALAAPLSYGTMGASRGSGGRDNMVKLVPKPYNPSNVHSGCAEPQKKAQIFSPTISIMCKTQNFVSVWNWAIKRNLPFPTALASEHICV